MVKKVLLTGLVFAGLLFFGLSGRCFADAEALLEQAHRYVGVGNRQQAEQIYKRIVEDYPGTDYALEAQTELVSVSIPNKEDVQIQAAISSLSADFSGHPGLPAALCDIAASYGWSRKHEQAKALYQQVILQWPESSAVRKAQLGISRTNIVSLIQAGDYTGAVSKIDKMCKDFSGHPYLPAALYQIAKTYHWEMKYEEAANIRQLIIQLYPDSREGYRARFDAAETDILSLIKSGNYAKAAAELDKLGANFNGHLSLYKVMSLAGGQYYKQASRKEAEGLETEAKDLYQKAVTVWERVIQESPLDVSTAVACYFSGHCYRKLGDYEKAIECCEKVAADWPGCEYACDAQFLIGHSYEKLAKAGAMSKSEAEAKIKAAYQSIVENYPGCESARQAQDWLNRHNAE